MSLLADYDHRTAWKYRPIRGCFPTAQGLANKVNSNGSYASFPGSTVVFKLNEQSCEILRNMQHTLYLRLDHPDLLAAPLPVSSFHMTLHDLVCPERCMSDPNHKVLYAAEVDQSLRKAAGIVDEIRQDYPTRRILMVADRVVNMVCKSLVLLLRPDTEEDYEVLLDMYRRFEGIIPLPYPFTPHITLAYYRPGMLDGNSLARAVESIQICDDRRPVFELTAENLTAQFFRDMQHYQAVQA